MKLEMEIEMDLEMEMGMEMELDLDLEMVGKGNEFRIKGIKGFGNRFEFEKKT